MTCSITLVISIALVILVVFVFLRNVRATLIPSVAVPVSLVGTFGVMYLLGYSLDNLSLMALTIATGFVVDDAIVVIENITRHLEQGMTPLQAALQGAKEIGFTVLSISISLIAVFIPILLMGGIVGRLFREFAVTLSVAILVSMVVSLTTTPMMCALLLRAHEPRNDTAACTEPASGRFNWHARAATSASLSWVLRHQPLTLAVTLLTMALTVYLYIIIPKGFFPQQDTGRIIGSIAGRPGHIVPSHAQPNAANWCDIVMADPAVDTSIGFTGGSGGTSNTGRMFITLKPLDGAKDQRRPGHRAPARQAGAHAGGHISTSRPMQDLRVGGRSSTAQYQYTLQGDNVKRAQPMGPEDAGRACARSPDCCRRQQRSARPRPASSLGHRSQPRPHGSASTPQMIDDTLYDAFGQRQVSTMYTPLNQYHVVMEVDPAVLAEPRRTCSNIYVRAANGGQVPLSAFTHYEPANTPLAVNHQGQFPSVTISFNLAPGTCRSAMRSTPIETAEQRDRHCRPSIHGSFQGTAQAFQASLANEPLLIAAALVTVYIVLGMLYESYIHPITILSTLPSAGVGALLALLLCRTDLNVIALIGIILLIGIVKKNAIMMIDFALEAERKRRQDPERRDLRGLPAALPADHDDDDGGAAWARCRWRSALGLAPSCAARWASPSSAG